MSSLRTECAYKRLGGSVPLMHICVIKVYRCWQGTTNDPRLIGNMLQEGSGVAVGIRKSSAAAQSSLVNDISKSLMWRCAGSAVCMDIFSIATIR